MCIRDRLYRNGVYLTSDEFRGRREIKRGALSISVQPAQFLNPFAIGDIPIRSSGSRSDGTQVLRDLDYVIDNTASMLAFLEARQCLDAETASWSVPGGVTLSNLIKFYCAGTPPLQWFSQVDTNSRELSSRYNLSHLVIRIAGALAGIRVPPTQYVSLEDPRPILHWMEDCLSRGKTPYLLTFSTSAVRLAQSAASEGINLQGAKISMSGEPSTPARLETVRNSGADALPVMGCVELGHVADGCLLPKAPDDMHLMKDLHAVIQPGETGASGNLPPNALLFSSLRKKSQMILINLSLGDQGTIKTRSCGCPLESLGYDTHIQYIRSFEKLTSGGMSFLDSDIIRILEVELPRIFGGGPTDYQLLEEEKEDGTPRLRLVVHPRIDPLDTKKAKEIFLKLIGSGPGAEKLTSLIWRDSSMITVDRNAPLLTSTGKIQHMHIVRADKKTKPGE